MTWQPPEEVICEECGNDLACEGYIYCSECLELLGHEADLPLR
jgi:hypothetical protein